MGVAGEKEGEVGLFMYQRECVQMYDCVWCVVKIVRVCVCFRERVGMRDNNWSQTRAEPEMKSGYRKWQQCECVFMCEGEIV